MQATEYRFNPLDELLTPQETADTLGCSVSKVRKLYGAQKLIALWISRRIVRIPKSDAIRFLKAEKSLMAN